MIHLLVFLHRSLQEILQRFLPVEPSENPQAWLSYHPFMCIWLVVSTPLKNIGQLGWWNSQYMESHKIHVPNHQPVCVSKSWYKLVSLPTSVRKDDPHIGVHIPCTCQWEFQDLKMEVLYYIRLYFVGIFPYIGLKHRPYIWNRYLQSIGSCCMAIEYGIHWWCSWPIQYKRKF